MKFRLKEEEHQRELARLKANAAAASQPSVKYASQRPRVALVIGNSNYE